MKRIFIIILFISCSANFTLAQLQYFEDDFDEYISGQQLACQNPIDWTTWSNLPCDPLEDPSISINLSLSGQNSVLITQYNDLIKPLGNITTGRNYIRFYFYIPSNHSGYFALLSKFTPEPYEWAVDCYFDVGGSGRFIIGSSETINFNYEYNQWQFVEIIIDLEFDQAQFSLNNVPINFWQWSQNGTITKQLAAHNFFGLYASTNEMYIDNYYLDGDCLNCYPPSAPSNLFVQQIFNPQAQVKLNWQDNSGNEDAFKILRKNGLPNSANSYTSIDTVLSNTIQYSDSNIIVDSTYTYGIIAFNIHGNSDASNFATITVEPVPVEVVSFTFNVINNNVQLNWSTATETNNSGFEILRGVYPAKSGTQNDNDWQNIGFVTGHGTTTEPQFYSFIDESVSLGEYQYRLKQIDFDGSYEYSNIIEVIVEAPNEFTLEQNYPNPFNPSTKIKYTIPSATPRQAQSDILVTLKVYDVLGNEVATLVNEEKPAGEYEVEFDASNLPSGIYFYQLKVYPANGGAGSFIETKKMVLLK